MNPDFGHKHLTGLAWLLPLIAIVIAVLLIIRKKNNFGEKFDRAVICYTCYYGSFGILPTKMERYL